MNNRQAPTGGKRTQNGSPSDAPPQESARSAEIVKEIDRLLDEIDAALEDQALLADFRQQPGQ